MQKLHLEQTVLYHHEDAHLPGIRKCLSLFRLALT